jgi:hypothetical protein
MGLLLWVNSEDDLGLDMLQEFVTIKVCRLESAFAQEPRLVRIVRRLRMITLTERRRRKRLDRVGKNGQARLALPGEYPAQTMRIRGPR